jgi:hypothetical protein
MQSPAGPTGGRDRSTWLKAVAALLFVTGLGVALAIPVIRSSEGAPASDERRRPKPRRMTTTAPATPAPLPSPSPSPAPATSPSPSVAANRFVTPYPDHCLDAVTPPSGTGLAAAYDGAQVSIAPASGGETTSFRADPPVAWAPTGDVLATGGGKLWTADGDRDGNLFASERGQWAWSPIANCAIQASPEGVFASSIHGKDKLLTPIGAIDLAISPDGTRLALVHEDDSGAVSLLFADLRKGTLREGLPPTDEASIALHGWAPDGVTLLYSLEGEADGAKTLLGVARGEGPEAYSGDEVVPAAGAISGCGSELLGVVGPGRLGRAGNRLALLNAGESPDYLTGEGSVYRSPSCSPDGAFAVAVRNELGEGRAERRLFVLNVNDGSENEITTGDYRDEHAEWADAVTAVLFVRKPRGAPSEVWLFEGSSGQPTGLTLAYYGPTGWGAALDWTATAPTGMPSR